HRRTERGLQGRPRRRRGARGDPDRGRRQGVRGRRGHRRDGQRHPGRGGGSGVILTGGGRQAFAAGADIAEMANDTPAEAEDKTRHGQRLTRVIENLGKPVIAAVNGFALGGGCELAMACTIRLAVEAAKFGQPEVTIGIIPGYGGTQRLPRLVGKGRALQLILSADMIDAHEAYRIGLVNEIVAKDNLIPRAEAILNKINANAPTAVKLAIEAANRGLDVSLA